MMSESKKPIIEHRSPCPISRSLDLLGDRWTLLIMRDALFLNGRTFADFCASRERIPTNLLSDRLRKLVGLGLLAKVPYQTRPTRYEYVPTELGKALKPVLRALKSFGEEHLDGHQTGE
ncbi:helix-turn-helix transcriptional regulator [Luminiphilus sp.]|jgi:DNA-binding HxlR family transcriptional regulator|nr:helix-turn-helix transcriptional regulator [Luminiphilus sp.]